jgi:soluble lytic murein transglycosylase-like protein
VARAILDAAQGKDVDVNLAFALVWAESDFKPKTKSYNKDKSVDRGLFQLNSKTFPSLSEKDAFEPQVNARMGINHLSFCLDYTGNEIQALAAYNAGLSRAEGGRVPVSTYAYIEKVLTYRDRIEKRFKDELLSFWIPHTIL